MARHRPPATPEASGWRWWVGYPAAKHGTGGGLARKLVGARRFDLLVERLPATPVTAALLASGRITVDQAISILSATKRLSGDTLADVEADAAHAALARNERGDDPDVESDVDLLVQQTRTATEQDRRDRDRLDRNQVRVQPDQRCRTQ